MAASAAPKPRNSNRLALVLLGFSFIGTTCMLYYHLGLFMPRVREVSASRQLAGPYAFGDDFYPIWLTTRQWRSEHLDLYGQAMTREIQTGIFGRPLDPRFPQDPPVEYRQFAYPAFADLLLWPSSLLTFPTLRLVLAFLLPILTVVSIRLWLLAVGWDVGPLWFATFSLLTLCTYELLEAFFAEQPGLIVSLALAAALLALRRNRLFLAGVLAGVTLIKPQMTIWAIAYLLLWSVSERGRLRFVAGFTSITATLLLASWWIWPHWTSEWIAILFGYHRYAMPPLVRVLFGSPYFATTITAGLLGFSALVAWRNRRASPNSLAFWTTLSLMLAVTAVAILPGQAIYDHVILLPGILLLWRHWREIRAASPLAWALLAICVVVVFWPLVASFALIASHPFAPALYSSYVIFTSPIRTAASLPFLVLALLIYALRVLRPAREPA